MRPALRIVPKKPENEAPSIADADLVLRVQSGDRWAEDALYRRYARAVFGLVMRLLGSAEEVEDVVHDAFVTAFEKMNRLREPSAFRAWLMQIAITHVRRVLRRRRLRRALGLLPSAEAASFERFASNTVSPETRADLAVVDGILSRLPSDQRIAWVLRHVEGHRLEEIADLCRCSLATVKRRIGAAERAMSVVIDVRTEEGR
jgi:RNA polymerase sigma-70 factor, ECF subfamily